MKPLRITQTYTDRDSLALAKYLNDISKYDPITAEKEVELAILIRNGDTKALTSLVTANLRFVVSVAKQYQNRGVELIDLINEGNMGLMKAAQRFDETRGFKFISFAVWWIRQSILELIHNNGKLVRVPVNKNNLANKFMKSFANLEQQLQRTPTSEEVVATMGLEDGEKIDIAQLLSKSYSIDTKITEDDDATFADMLTSDSIPGPDHSSEVESMKIDISNILRDLSEREQMVIKMFFGIGGSENTLSEIGEKMEYTSERIRQIKESALQKLRSRGSAKKLKAYL